MAVHYKGRFSALAFVAVGFVDPSVALDIGMLKIFFVQSLRRRRIPLTLVRLHE